MARRCRHDHGVLLGVTRTSHAITAEPVRPKGVVFLPRMGKRGNELRSAAGGARLSRGQGTIPLRATRMWLVFSPHGVNSSPNRLTPADSRHRLTPPDALPINALGNASTNHER